MALKDAVEKKMNLDTYIRNLFNLGTTILGTVTTTLVNHIDILAVPHLKTK